MAGEIPFYTARRGILLDTSTIVTSAVNGGPSVCKSEHGPDVLNYMHDFNLKGIVTPQILREARRVVKKNYSGRFVDGLDDLVADYLIVQKVPYEKAMNIVPHVKEVYSEARGKFNRFTQRAIGSRKKKKGNRFMKLKKDGSFKHLHHKLFNEPPSNMDIFIIAQAAYLRKERHSEMFVAASDTHFCPVKSAIPEFERLIPDTIAERFGVICEHPLTLGNMFYEEEQKKRKSQK